MGIRVVIYLDDILLLHQDKEELRNLFNKVLELLQNLGFTINREKCSSAPTQSLVFLGGLLNSVNMTISLPSEKLNAITKAAQEMQKDQEVTEKVLSSFLGRLSHAAQTGVWTAPLHYRSIQQQHVNMARQASRWPTAARVSLSQRSIQELTWWQSAEVQTFNGQPLQLPAFDMTISTDASLLGWGATWPGTTIGGRWLPTEAKGHINLLELKAAHLALQAFLTKTHLVTDGQFDSSGVCQQTRRDKVVQPINRSTEAMGTGSPGRLLDYCQAYSRNNEHNSRFGLSSIPQLRRVDTQPRCVSSDNATILSTGSGSLCHSSQSPPASVCIQIPGSGCYGNRCIPLRLGSVEELGLRTPGPYAEDRSEDQEGRGNCSDTGTILERPTMVPEPSRVTGGLPTTVTTDSAPNHSPLPAREGTSTSTLTAVDCMARVRQRYRADGLSETATNVLLSSWSESTRKRYSGPWNAWSSWCRARSLCPFTAPVNSVLTFLAEIAERDHLAFRTIGVYKSAISQTHDPVGSVPLGELPIVSRFMKGVFRMNPPQPKLCSTWKVQVALEHLKRQQPIEELSLRELSGNLVLLLALTSAARAHELAALDLNHFMEKEDSWEFSLDIHVKQSRPGHPARKIYLPAYPADKKLCVVSTLKAYRARTMTIRQSSKLLLALIAPHAPVSSQTVSRWLRNVLKLAGINPTFTGHSTRSASTTAAAEVGVPLEVILEAADWSSAGTFRTHYLRPTNLGKETFAKSVISG